MDSHRTTGTDRGPSRPQADQQNLQHIAAQASAAAGARTRHANQTGCSGVGALRAVYVPNSVREALNKAQQKLAARILEGPQGEVAQTLQQPQVDRIQGLFDKMDLLVEKPLGQVAEAGPGETLEERGKLVMAHIRHVEELIQLLP